MRIIELIVENVKRIRAIALKPLDGLNVISGKNASGKSSILDAIEWVFAGTRTIQSEPIRRGAKKGRIQAKIGGKDVELIIERHFAAGKPSTLSVTTPPGVPTPPGGPQAILNALIGPLSFDPLEFARMTPEEQFRELIRVFPIGVDLKELAGLNKADYDRRTKVNGEARSLRTQAEAIVISGGLPAEPIDESAILDRMAEASDHNAGIEKRKSAQKDTERAITDERERADGCRQRAAELREQADRMEQDAVKRNAHADQLQNGLDTAPALPKPVDVAEVRAELDAARKTNADIANRDKRTRLAAEAEKLEAQSRQLTDDMEARETAKQDALAAAKLPVEGLGIGDGIVTFNGLPFDQASASETLRVSMAIGMAANPDLRVMLIRDGSLLDSDSRAQVESMAASAEGGEYQVFMEIADEGLGGNGFVIEDGGVKEVGNASAVLEA